jgi:drug/metabolite transporter (DMT)-like permease
MGGDDYGQCRWRPLAGRDRLRGGVLAFRRLVQLGTASARVTPRLRVAVGYVGLCSLWSTSWLAIKIGLHGAPPLLALAVRLLGGGTLLGLYQLVRGVSLSVPGESRRYVVFTAVALFALPQTVVYLGETQIGSGLAAILYGALPLYAALIAGQLLPDEPLTLAKLAGVALGVIGLVIVFGGSLSLTASSLAILAMVGFIGAPAAQALAQVVAKRDAARLPVTVLLTWSSLIAGAMVLVAALAFEPHRIAVDIRTLGSIGYMTLGSSFVGISLNFWLLTRIGAVPVSLVYQITPLLALLWGFALYGERLNVEIAVGAIIVAAGIGLASGIVPRPHRDTANRRTSGRSTPFGSGR